MIKEQYLDLMLKQAIDSSHNIYKDNYYHATEWHKVAATINGREGLGMDTLEFSMYCEFLVDEGMIVEMKAPTHKDAYTERYYLITPKGYFFEGYERQRKIIDAELLKTDLENQKELRNATRVVTWTIVATVVASGILLLELWKYFHPASGGGETMIKQIGIFF
jgi:hypothetical protein